MALYPPLRGAYSFDPPGPQILARTQCFARLHLLSSGSFSSLIFFPLSFFSSLTLPTSAFPSVHIVGSFTAKLLSEKFYLPICLEIWPAASCSYIQLHALPPWVLGAPLVLQVQVAPLVLQVLVAPLVLQVLGAPLALQVPGMVPQ